MTSPFPVSILQSEVDIPRSTDMIVAVDPVSLRPKNFTVAGLALALGLSTLPILGALGDGTTDDTAAVTQAEASAPYFVPPGTYPTTIDATSMRGPWHGPGIIKDSGGNKRANMFSAITAAPASLGNYNSVTTFFNGDMSKSQIVMEHRITGSATLGNPTSGYLYTPEAYPINVYMFMQNVGHNESLSTNTGRTAAVLANFHIANAGQGDCMAIHVTAVYTNTKSGATGFLASPAVSAFVASLFAGAAHGYLNPIEILMDDQGNDCAMVGAVFNLKRTVVTAALGEIANGIRVQSIGSAQIDSGITATGSMITVFDAVHATSDSAFAMKSGDKLHFNATADARTVKSKVTLNNYYMSYASSILSFVINNVANLQIGANSVTIASANGLVIASTGCLRLTNSSQFTTGSSTATFSATNKPGASTSVGPTQWMLVVCNGSNFYCPLWAA